jgi:hypothetical protein
MLRAWPHVTGKAVAMTATTGYHEGGVSTTIRLRIDEVRFVE